MKYNQYKHDAFDVNVSLQPKIQKYCHIEGTKQAFTKRGRGIEF